MGSSDAWTELATYLEARFPDQAEGALARIRSRVEAGKELLEVAAEIDTQLRLMLERKLGPDRAARKIGENVKEYERLLCKQVA